MDIKTVKRLLSFCRPYMKYLYCALLCSSGQIVFTLLTPVFIGQAVDHIIGQGLVAFDLLFQKMLLCGKSLIKHMIGLLVTHATCDLVWQVMVSTHLVI